MESLDLPPSEVTEHLEEKGIFMCTLLVINVDLFQYSCRRHHRGPNSFTSLSNSLNLSISILHFCGTDLCTEFNLHVSFFSHFSAGVLECFLICTSCFLLSSWFVGKVTSNIKEIFSYLHPVVHFHVRLHV